MGLKLHLSRRNVFGGLLKIPITKLQKQLLYVAKETAPLSDFVKGIMVMSEILTPNLVAQILTALGSVGFFLLAIQALRLLKQ